MDEKQVNDIDGDLDETAAAEQAEEIQAYHRVDWVLAWTPRENWQLQLSADNLLDESYETSVGFPGPGRSFRLGVRYAN